MKNNDVIDNIAIAIYTVNRHAKTASNNKELYQLKKLALDKLLQIGEAEKVGLHFVDNPKFSQQHSTMLIRCRDFYFHSIPEKEDFKTLPHLGLQDQTFRNPQERMNLKTAKDVLSKFIGLPPIKKPIRQEKKSNVKKSPLKHTNEFRSSYLDGR